MAYTMPRPRSNRPSGGCILQGVNRVHPIDAAAHFMPRAPLLAPIPLPDVGDMPIPRGMNVALAELPFNTKDDEHSFNVLLAHTHRYVQWDLLGRTTSREVLAALDGQRAFPAGLPVPAMKLTFSPTNDQLAFEFDVAASQDGDISVGDVLRGLQRAMHAPVEPTALVGIDTSHIARVGPNTRNIDLWGRCQQLLVLGIQPVDVDGVTMYKVNLDATV